MGPTRLEIGASPLNGLCDFSLLVAQMADELEDLALLLTVPMTWNASEPDEPNADASDWDQTDWQ